MRETAFFLPLLIVKYLPLLISYKPMLDDYIQFRSYTFFDVTEVFFKIGTIYTRPLATVFDYYFWSMFWDNLNIGVFIIMILLYLTVGMIKEVLAHMSIKLGTMFYVLVFLAPIGNEATMWLSASNRIIVGLFFAFISFMCLIEYLNTSSKRHLCAFLFFNLAAMLFYEQVSIICVIFTFFLVPRKKFIMLMFPVINIIIIVVYYLAFQHVGAFGLRLNTDTATTVLESIYNMVRMLYVGGEITLLNIERGINVLQEQMLLIIPLCISLLVIGFKLERSQHSNKKLLIGAVVFVSTFTPFLVSSGYCISLRTAFCPLIGLALMIDCVPTKFLAYVMSIFFMVSNVADVNDYVIISHKDYEILSNVSERVDKRLTSTIRGYKIEDHGVYRYHEHIRSSLEQDWAILGAMRALLEDPAYNNMKIYEEGKEYDVVFEWSEMIDRKE